MKLLYKDPSKENWFLVSWTLSNKCNYKCSYCPDELHNGSTGHADWKRVEKFIDNFTIPKKDICYRISGGEPTYWKHFIDMAQLIKSKNATFTFLTNGSQSIDYYKKISRYTDGLIISYHPQYANIDHFIKIAEVMNCPVFVNLMMVPDKFDSMINIAENLFNGNENINIWPKVVLDKSSNVGFITNKVLGYTDEQKEKIANWKFFRKVNDANLHRGSLLLDDKDITANDLILKNLNQYKGWKCWAGLDMINIDMWGDIYRADCQQGGKIGTLDNYELPTQPLICGANKCACLSDIYLRKEQ